MIEIQALCDAGVLFENADWRVLDDGLEHRDTGYFVARDGLGRRSESGLWEWPLHLAEKRWCSPRLFREAFLAATDLFDLERDEALGRSFALGFGLRMGQGGVAGADDFTKLAELVRPRSVARRRPVGADLRAPSHHGPIGRPEEADAARAVRS